jgi:hypothetical protein
MELVRMQQRATVGSKSTLKELAARSIGNAGPDIKGWENEFQVKITLENLPDRGYDASIQKGLQHVELFECECFDPCFVAGFS